MLKFAANLSMMYPDRPFLDRFAAAAQDGFLAVEYLFPYEFPAAEIRARLDDSRLDQVLFNAPAGDWAQGERGIASIPGRENEFRSGVGTAMAYAQELRAVRVHVMAGIPPAGADLRECAAAYRANVAYAAAAGAEIGVGITIEPINHRDMPGYFLHTQEQAHAVVAGSSNVQVQLDLYHCQITEGDLITTIRRDVPTGRVGHVQIAGVPDRHEPDRGEVAYSEVLAELDASGYTGWVGCEYHPRGDTSDGLHWIEKITNGARRCV